MGTTYGTGFIELAHGLLKARLDALKTAMVGTVDPLIANVYDYPDVPDLRLSAVTIHFLRATAVDPFTAGSGRTIDYRMQFELRVHVAYRDGYVDAVKAQRLLQSCVNWLKEKLNLDDTNNIDRVTDLGNRLDFSESATRGAACLIEVLTRIQYTRV